MQPRLRERYQQDIRDKLSQEFGYGNVHQVPRLTKIVVNIGLGEAAQNPKLWTTPSRSWPRSPGSARWFAGRASPWPTSSSAKVRASEPW